MSIRNERPLDPASFVTVSWCLAFGTFGVPQSLPRFHSLMCLVSRYWGTMFNSITIGCILLMNTSPSFRSATFKCTSIVYVGWDPKIPSKLDVEEVCGWRWECQWGKLVQSSVSLVDAGPVSSTAKRNFLDEITLKKTEKCQRNLCILGSSSMKHTQRPVMQSMF